MKTVPVSLTYDCSRSIAGDQSPVVQRPMTTATWLTPLAETIGLVEEDPAEVVAVGQMFSRRKGSAQLTSTRQPILGR